MLTRIEQLSREIPQANREIALYAKHVIEALEQFEECHRKIVAMQAIAGVKPEGAQEKVFYETLSEAKHCMLEMLQLTIDDLKHKGDKHHEKHFIDGVE
jgi:hypothetical protein